MVSCFVHVISRKPSGTSTKDSEVIIIIIVVIIIVIIIVPSCQPLGFPFPWGI